MSRHLLDRRERRPVPSASPVVRALRRSGAVGAVGAVVICVALGASGCSQAPTAGPSASSTLRPNPVTTTAGGTTPRAGSTTSTTTSVSSSTTAAPGSRAALFAQIAADWENSIQLYYQAGAAGNLNLTALDRTLVPDGPELKQETAFLGVQVGEGIIGPSTWRIGNARVVGYNKSGTAVVEGCSWDPGSHFLSTGAEAPASLGGGAGYTAFVSDMDLSGGRWLLDSTQVSAPTSTKEAGPCEGFS